VAKGEEVFFTSETGKAIKWEWYSKRLKTTLRDMGEAGNFHIHGLRSGGLTDMITAGVPMELCARYGKWTSDAMSKLYWRVDPMEVADTVRSRAVDNTGGR
jgi:hypothetical protein